MNWTEDLLIPTGLWSAAEKRRETAKRKLYKTLQVIALNLPEMGENKAAQSESERVRRSQETVGRGEPARKPKARKEIESSKKRLKRKSSERGGESEPGRQQPL